MSRKFDIAGFRDELGSTAKEIARMLGLTRRYADRDVRRWLNGERKPGTTTQTILDRIQRRHRCGSKYITGKDDRGRDVVVHVHYPGFVALVKHLGHGRITVTPLVWLDGPPEEPATEGVLMREAGVIWMEANHGRQ